MPDAEKTLIGLARRLWWLPVLLIVVLVVFVNGVRRDDDGQISAAGRLSVSELRVGDCFDADQAGNIAWVEAGPCDDPHRYELYHIGEWPDADTAFPSDLELEAFVFDTCLPAFGAYTGRDIEGSGLFFSPIIPDEASWDAGRRVVYCALFDLGGEQLIGSQRAP
jgi:hypothetical protein